MQQNKKVKSHVSRIKKNVKNEKKVKVITVSHDSGYTVVMATQQVNGKWQFWGYQNSVTPEQIDRKFDTRDYVGELTSYAKFHKIRRHKD